MGIIFIKNIINLILGYLLKFKLIFNKYQINLYITGIFYSKAVLLSDSCTTLNESSVFAFSNL